LNGNLDNFRISYDDCIAVVLGRLKACFTHKAMTRSLKNDRIAMLAEALEGNFAAQNEKHTLWFFTGFKKQGAFFELFMRTKRLNSLGKQRCEGGTEFNFLFFHMI